MKKLCCMLFVLAAAPLFALRPGDAATKFEKVKWLRGSGIVAEGDSKPRNPKDPELRAAVFMLTRAENSVETMQMLDALRRQYSYRLKIAVLTPDNRSDAEEFLKKLPKDGVSFGLDVERSITPRYMAGSLLYPMTFLIDDSGTIIWCGEAIDLAEAAQRFFAGKLDAGKQKEIATLLDQMQALMRDNSERQMAQTTARILELEPGNACALRMRLFLLENGNRAPEAWKLLRSQLDAAPGLARLYFTALDMIGRTPALKNELHPMLEDFRKNISDENVRLTMAWNLLRAFEFDADAFSEAAELLGNRTGKTSAQREATAALLAYRLGDLSGAIDHQEKALAQLKGKSDPFYADMAAFAEFYRKLREVPAR